MIELLNFSEVHLEETFLWIQNESFKYYFLFDRKVTSENHKEWFKNIENDEQQKVFAIMYNGQHVGNIGLKDIDLANRKAETWIYLGNDTFKGRGIAKNSLKALQQFAKRDLDLHKLYAHVADFNHISLKTFLGADFKIEGLLHEEREFQGKFINLFRLYFLS